ncbi:hypothetical protein L218DRAFT_1036269 [Marasmius fiardii PR-910]|nr:hypothetical protein L218DRAFT_1036269 [Marasmius fiardii PR-910]
MGPIAGKKSTVFGTELKIDASVANHDLINQAAVTSLYQECSRLKACLMRLRGFEYYFSLVAASYTRQPTDPVTQLWDLFSYGIPLCYIFDLLPADMGYNKINNSKFEQEAYEASPDRVKKRAIALFSMQLKHVTDQIPEVEQFMVTELWNRHSTDGLVKVIKTVKAIVGYLPEDVWEDVRSSSSSNPPETARNIIREIVETERKYVQDLEIMQKYAIALSRSNIINQDTIHLLFPNLNQVLNFQRKFLIRIEGTAELPWHEQRWGQHFMDSEEDFRVYEPYCANYTAASELMLIYEQSLSALNHLINVKGELPAFLFKPIQRVCQYPLLLNSLIKASSDDNYPHLIELEAGSEAVKRTIHKINEARRQGENESAVRNLQSRVEDWKGHRLENFGQLMLYGVFIVTKSDVDREYHIFLFEKILICCREALPGPVNGRKVSKSNSILKKQSVSMLSNHQKNIPLLLKGRVFLGNITQVVPGPSRTSISSGIPTEYPLAVWWKGDDGPEYITLRCKLEDQRQQWESTINRLIRELAQRRAIERGLSRKVNNNSDPALDRDANQSYPLPHHDSTAVTVVDSVCKKEQTHNVVPYGGSPQGSPLYDFFESKPDDDDYENFFAANAYASTSGLVMLVESVPKGTPSLPAESTYLEATFDAPSNARPNTPPLPLSLRPRLHSNMSDKIVSTRPRTTDESGDCTSGIISTPTTMDRSGSIIRSSAYVPKSVPLSPLPTTQWDPWSNSSVISSKRDSGASNISFYYSPSPSPIPVSPGGGGNPYASYERLPQLPSLQYLRNDPPISLDPFVTIDTPLQPFFDDNSKLATTALGPVQEMEGQKQQKYLLVLNELAHLALGEAEHPEAEKILPAVQDSTPAAAEIIVSHVQTTSDKSITLEDDVATSRVLDDVRRLLEGVLENGQRSKKLVESNGEDAQLWLDALQALAKHPEIPTRLRSSTLKAMLRLSKKSDLIPKCLMINNIEKLGDYPVGYGGFGDLWMGKVGGQVLGLKVPRISRTSDVQKLLRDYNREAIVWQQLDHPNVLPFMGIYYMNEARTQLCLVSPWMEQGNLVTFLETTPREEVDLYLLVYDVASGLAYLHRMKVVHGDLKGVSTTLHL